MKLTWKMGRAIARSFQGNEVKVWLDGFAMARDDFMYRHGRELECGCTKFLFWFATYRMGCPANHGGMGDFFTEEKFDLMKCPACSGITLEAKSDEANCTNCGHQILGFKGF